MSKYYDQLITCENSIKKTLITKTVLKSVTTKTSQFRLKSYRLMVHAEIEYFIERIVLNKVDYCYSEWQKTKIIPNVLSNILAYTKSDFPNVSQVLAETSNKNDIIYRLNKSVANFKGIVKNNNGVKEKDVIPLLLSLGVDYTKISQTLLNNLSSYGSLRGDIAHNSLKVHNLINPSDELSMVSHILTELKDIDQLVDNA